MSDVKCFVQVNIVEKCAFIIVYIVCSWNICYAIKWYSPLKSGQFPDGTWAAWGSWSSCSSRFCGFLGRRTRTRACVPPRRITRRCERLNEYPCPRNSSSESAFCNGCGDPNFSTARPRVNTGRPRVNTGYPYYPSTPIPPRNPRQDGTCNIREYVLEHDGWNIFKDVTYLACVNL